MPLPFIVTKWEQKNVHKRAFSLNHVDSPYRTAISGAVLKLQEDGKLSALKEKWWKGGLNLVLFSKLASRYSQGDTVRVRSAFKGGPMTPTVYPIFLKICSKWEL